MQIFLPASFLFHLLRFYLFFLQVLVSMADLGGEVCLMDCVTR